MRIGFLALLLSSALLAQRAFEVGGAVVYEDAHGKRTSLGIGFNPVLTHDGRVAWLRGPKFGYGDQDCSKAANWVLLYDPATKAEKVLFDKPIFFNEGKWKFCTFEQMQLSYDRSVLYLVSPVYATAGSLAIVHLAGGPITYVPGVNFVYVIETGPHRDELIYQRRIWPKSAEHPEYPLIHARADGRQIAEISNECLSCGGNNDEVPVLRKYLGKLGGSITMNGQKFP
jgi:hypothetical protein